MPHSVGETFGYRIATISQFARLRTVRDGPAWWHFWRSKLLARTSPSWVAMSKSVGSRGPRGSTRRLNLGSSKFPWRCRSRVVRFICNLAAGRDTARDFQTAHGACSSPCGRDESAQKCSIRLPITATQLDRFRYLTEFWYIELSP